MHPVIVRIGDFSIYSYGMMVALGYMIAAILIYKRAAAMNYNPTRILDILFVALAAGIAGARIFYVLLNARYYIGNPLEVLNLTKGGLVWYGGFLSGLLALLWYTRKYRIDTLRTLDLVAPYLALAQAVGRIGCFLNGCCYGLVAKESFPFAITFPGSDILRHPTQIYSALILILVFIILRLWQNEGGFRGRIFLGYCILYSVKRFGIEFLRGDNPRFILGLTVSQTISILMLISASAAFLYLYRRHDER